MARFHQPYPTLFDLALLCLVWLCLHYSVSMVTGRFHGYCFAVSCVTDKKYLLSLVRAQAEQILKKVPVNRLMGAAGTGFAPH